MLSELEVGQFQAFGYVVLRQCLSPAEMQALTVAYDRVIADAPIYNYFAKNDTRMITGFVLSATAPGMLSLSSRRRGRRLSQ